jgi:hypothetical protein
VTYPDLYARDALAMGGVQALAVLAPTAFWRAIPRLLLVAALAYFLLGPRYYWRDVEASDVMARGGAEKDVEASEGEGNDVTAREDANGDAEELEVADREVEGKRS